MTPPWIDLSQSLRTTKADLKALRRLAARLARVLGTHDLQDLQSTVNDLRRAFLQATSEEDTDALPLRLVGSLLCDLALQGWRLDATQGRLRIAKPESAGQSAEELKSRVRIGHLLERDRQLAEPPVRRFVHAMETPHLHLGAWRSIFDLMRDGPTLLASLDLPEGHRAAIQPYLQLADGDKTCSHTGLRLLDIWRYFRMTWSTAHHSTPGRRMYLLIRDAAAHCHPVIGIAALGSPVVQSTVRDEWIGWTPRAILEALRKNPTVPMARWALEQLKEAQAGIYVNDLLKARHLPQSALSRPTTAQIERLRALSDRHMALHRRYPDAARVTEDRVRPERAYWRALARSPLFVANRLRALAAVLEIRRVFTRHGLTHASAASLARVLDSPDGRRALGALIRLTKSRRVGIDMAEVTVCGAVAPYSHLLGGKLVALLLASPQVAQLYDKRYRASPSLIASAVAGKLVVRPPRLVLLGTTSLYHIGASQYNRLRIPQEAFGGRSSGPLAYIPLGVTEGYGSYHLSQTTIDQINALGRKSRLGRRVNSIFGEGVSPKLRKVREALDHVGLPSDDILKHGSARIVYGVPLSLQFREYLLGQTDNARHLLASHDLGEGTRGIIEYWQERWLRHRKDRPEVRALVAASAAINLREHRARVPRPSILPSPPPFPLVDDSD